MLEPPQAPTGKVTARISQAKPRSRRWIKRLIAVGLGVVPLIFLELLLTLLGFGRDLSLIVAVPRSPGWYQFNSLFDAPFYGQADLSGPEIRPFQLPRPPGTRRILVVGGSTVVGFPYPSELAFSRHLQVELNAQSERHETIEVLNAGITAMNSSTEVAVVQEGLKAQPDVIVVYTGHNEFYGPGGVSSSASWLSPLWHRSVAAWRRLRLFQMVRRLIKSRNPPTDLLETLPGDVHIGLNSETFRSGVTRFQENLTMMASLAGQAHIPIVFVTPVANEHDQPPIEDFHQVQNTVQDDWNKNLRMAEREMRWGVLAKAIEQLESAKGERDQDPVVRFRLAQAYEKAERKDAAKKQFQMALDLDGCRFRAPTAFGQVMSDVAAQYRESGAKFVDLHSAICRNSEIGVPGRKHFLEHVHFTWEGNQLVAREIAKSIWCDVWSKDWSPMQSPDDVAMREHLAVQDEDHLAALALAMSIYQKLPFRLGLDAEKLGKALIDDSMLLFRRFPSDRQKLFEERSQQEMAGDLLGELIRACRGTGNVELLERWLKARVIRQPWRCEAVQELTSWLSEHDRPAEAAQVQSEAHQWPCPR